MDEFERFSARLDDLARSGGRLRLWLRDDDAVRPTPALDRLLSAMNRHGVPGLLAVIPAYATEALADLVAGEPLVQVAPHGWRHDNHQPPETKTAEFGAARPLADCAAELLRGRQVIEAAFGADALPIFVPPWNRIAPEVVQVLPGAGYAALSGFGADGEGPCARLNTHVDLIDWRGTRGGRPTGVLLDEFLDWAGRGERAVGFLTHHLDHDDAAWAFIDRFLAFTADHPAAEWVSPGVLLDEVLRAN